MLADTRPALIGQMLLQIEKTNRDVFDEVIVFDTGLNDNDKALMQKLMPCRFIKYESPISNELLKRDRFKRFSLIMFARYEMFRLLNDYSLIMWMDTDMVIQGSLVALLMVVVIVVKTLLLGDPVGGWPSLACMIMFMGGIQLLCIGVLGQYLAKTYLETKHRPIYIVAETNEDYHEDTTG